MKLYERIENNNFDEIDKNRAIELIEGGNGHLVYNENYFKLQKENEKLKALDSSNSKMIANMSKRHFQDREKIRNSIPIQKIKDKIEELNKKEQELQNSVSNEEREEYSDANISWNLMDIEIRREVLQELLEGEK